MTLAEFLRARLTEDEQPCEGAQEYQSCDELSERRGRDIDAKRRILDECNWGGPDHADVYDAVLQRLALPYADHPDYRDEWRP